MHWPTPRNATRSSTTGHRGRTPGCQTGREQQRPVERPRRRCAGRQAELQRAWRRRPRRKVARSEQQRATDELARLNDAAAQAGLQDALAIKLEREQALGALRSEYDDLTAKLRASDERRLQLERELDPLRKRITDFQLKEQAARLGVEQYSQLLEEAQADLAAVAQASPKAMCA